MATASKSKKAPSKKSSGAKKKVGKVMHEYKHGSLKSGSGGKVKSRKQAIAIGLSEARKSGAHVPPKKSASKKKSSGRKTTARKTTTKKHSK